MTAVTSRQVDPRPDTLLEHAEFLQRLARRLVQDEHRAEDLVQDTHLAALTGGPTQPAALKAWLAGVLRHLSSNARRSQQRSAARERAAARPESVMPTDELRARLELQRLLATYVEELDEPYARVVFLRFYEGLPPRAIAERLGLPVNTVKTRLQRALERLRARLDRQAGGDRSAWCVTLLPLARGGGGASVGMGGVQALTGLLMQSKYVLALLTLAVAFSVWRFAVEPKGEADPTRVTRGVVAQEVEELDAPQAAVSGEALADPLLPGGRSPVEEDTAETVAQEAARELGDWNFTGMVTSATGSALPGARVVLRSEPASPRSPSPQAECDGEGRYWLSATVPAGVSDFGALDMTLVAFAEGHGALEQNLRSLRASEEAEGTRRIDFVLGPSAHAFGALTDPAGEIQADLPVALVDEGGTILSSSRTDGLGAFELVLGDADRFWVAAGAARVGYEVAGPFQRPAAGDLDAGTLVLRPRGVLEGVVLFPDGTSVKGTSVMASRVDVAPGGDLPDDGWLTRQGNTVPGFRSELGSAEGSARTDGQGRFRFRALLPGEYRVELPELGYHRERPTAGPFRTGEFARIVVEAYRVRVRVLDQDGLAVPGARLCLQCEEFARVSDSSGLDATQVFGVRPGHWNATASMDGAAPSEKTLEVVEGTYEYSLELVLDFEPVTGSLRLLVEDQDGAPVHGYSATLWREDDSVMIADYSNLEPDADGLLPPIPVGEYRVRAVFPGFAGGGSPIDYFSATGRARIEAGRTTTLGLTTTRGGRLHLRLTDPGGDGERVAVRLTLEDGQRSLPIHNLVTLLEQGTRWGSPTLGSHGITDLLAIGVYTLRAEADGYLPLELPVEVRPGDPVEVEVVLRRE